MTGTLVVEGQRNREVEVASKLQGTTLVVYWYLLANQRRYVGPREVARAIGFRSPSTAVFHLEKLNEMRVVTNDGSGAYRVSRVVKVGILRSFWFVSRFAFPKALAYAVLSTLAVLVSCMMLLLYATGWFPLAVLPGLLAALILWYEAITVWQLRPRTVKEGDREN